MDSNIIKGIRKRKRRFKYYITTVETGHDFKTYVIWTTTGGKTGLELDLFVHKVIPETMIKGWTYYVKVKGSKKENKKSG